MSAASRKKPDPTIMKPEEIENRLKDNIQIARSIMQNPQNYKNADFYRENVEVHMENGELSDEKVSEIFKNDCEVNPMPKDSEFRIIARLILQNLFDRDINSRYLRTFKFDENSAYPPSPSPRRRRRSRSSSSSSSSSPSSPSSRRRRISSPKSPSSSRSRGGKNRRSRKVFKK